MTRTSQLVQKPTVPGDAGAWHGLRISRPSDGHEHEADRFAGALTRNGLDPGDGLGHRFENVRVHHDTEADRAARRLNASAFTVGSDIYFRSGLYAPETDEGRQLLGHELLHVRQQRLAGLRLDRKVFSPEELEDMNPPSTTPQIGLLGSDPAFEQFADRLRTRYHARTVRRGTYADQAEEVATNRVDLPPGVTRGTLDRKSWKEWSPPSGWATYKAILDGIEAFAREFGGLPSIEEVLLFDVSYVVNKTTGVVEAAPNVGASYGHGQLTVYNAITKSSHIPAGRSGVPFAGREAELVPPASERQGIERSIAHELGHGVAEMALGPAKMGPDPSMIDDFQREVGWTPYQPETATSPAVPERLFDAGVPEVRSALQAGKEPPARYRITEYNWNEGRWLEQPISQYSTTATSEDFAEAVMAFLKVPRILKERSPRRYRFLETRKARWLPKARATSPQPSFGRAEEQSRELGNTPP